MADNFQGKSGFGKSLSFSVDPDLADIKFTGPPSAMTIIPAMAFALLVLPPAMSPGVPGLGTSGLCAESLDQEYYNDYLDSLPDERAQSKFTLERNLLRVARTIIPREDFKQGPDFARNLKEADLRYEKVTRASAFVRGIMKEMPYLKETEYMWIVKAGRYLVFVTFKADPRRFMVTAHQTRAVIKQEQQSPPSETPEGPKR